MAEARNGTPPPPPPQQRNGTSGTATAIAGSPLPAVEPLEPTPKGPSLTQEYVAGGDQTWYGNLVRALPPYIDDITADFGDDLYDRMLWDPQVSACVTYLKAAILEDGVHLRTAVDDVGDPLYELAKTILEEAEQMIEDMSTPLTDALWDMLAAMPLGNRVAEIKWAYADPARGGAQLINIQALKVKPRRATAFVVDAYTNVLGILARPAGFPSPFLATTQIDPNNPPPNLIPRSRFAILTHRPKDGDPRGTSILRNAYEPWWRKRQIRPEQLKYLAQFAGPSLWGTVPQNAKPQPQLDADGHPVPGAALMTPEQVLAGALQQIRNGTAGAFPFGTQINPIPVGSSAAESPFIQAAAEANHEITKTILTQQLATEESRHQTRAAAQVHEDVLDTIIRQQKQSVVRMLTVEVLRQWVLYNWGDKARRLVPKAGLGVTEERDRSQLMTAVAALYGASYLVGSQLQGTDEMLGLPIRTGEELPPSPAEQQQIDLAMAKAKATAAAAAAQGPQPPGPQQGQGGDQQAPGDQQPGNTTPPDQSPGVPGGKGSPPAAKATVPPASGNRVPPKPPGAAGRARMAAGEPVGEPVEPGDGATGTVSGRPGRILPDGEPLPANLTPDFTGIDRWTMAELWQRAVPEEYARMLRAPVIGQHPAQKTVLRSTRGG